METLELVDLSVAERRDADRYRRGEIIQVLRNARGGLKAGGRWTVVGRDPFGNVMLRCGLSLRAPLQSMGVRAPFRPGGADFGGFFTEPVLLDDILHRARITVNEEGTEAAAATAMLFFLSMEPDDPIDFALDRPFLFLLRDLRDGSLLFLGRVTDPR